MSSVRLQLDIWLKVARIYLTATLIDDIVSILKLRHIKLTQVTFQKFTDAFAIELETRNVDNAWKIVSQITSHFITELPMIQPKRTIINNHFHGIQDLVPALSGLTIGNPPVNDVATSSKQNGKHQQTNVTSREEDAKLKVPFPMICKIVECVVCSEFYEKSEKCKKLNCKRKHRGLMHYLSHSQRRRLSRNHQFRNPVNSGGISEENTQDSQFAVAEPASPDGLQTVNPSVGNSHALDVKDIPLPLTGGGKRRRTNIDWSTGLSISESCLPAHQNPFQL